MNLSSGNRRAVLVSLVLAGLTLLLYWPVHRHEFIDFDDPLYVSENQTVLQGLTLDGVAWAFGYHASNWHPLTWLSHMLDVELFGPRAGVHHLVNIFLHTLNSLLLFGVLRRMTGAFWRSAMVAALFAWHPLHVESVAWVAERKDVLSTAFWLGTMWLYARYVERPERGRYVAVLAIFALGLMAKPMLVTLPFALLLLDVWPLNRIHVWREGARWPHWDWAAWRPLVREKIPLFILVVLACAVTFVAQRTGGSVAKMEHFPILPRIANAMISYVAYVGKLFCPTDLAPFYPLRPDWPAWEIMGAALVLVAMTVGFLRASVGRPYLLMGWFWFLGTLVPVIGFVQVGSQSMADRYTYVPYVGLFVMLVWSLSDRLTKSKDAIAFSSSGGEGRGDEARHFRPSQPSGSGMLGIIPALALGTCLVVTHNYLKLWVNTATLFEHTLAVTGSSAITHTLLGTTYDRMGNTRLAIFHYQRGLQLNPGFADGHFNLGHAYVNAGQMDAAETEFRTAIRLAPNATDTADAYNNLGFVLAARGQYAEAITNYEQALKLKPKYASAHNNIAVAFENLNRVENAASHYEQSLALDSNSAPAHANLGIILARQGKSAEARPHFAAAARLNPKDAQAHFNLGIILAAEQKMAEALPELREAVRLRPDRATPVRMLAWILATHPSEQVRNGAEAVALAERANALGKNADPMQLDTLAAAYAEAGRFEEATKNARKAHDAAEAMGQTKLAQAIEQRLELYGRKQAYREEVR